MLCEIFSITPIMINGEVEENTMQASMLARFESSGSLPVGTHTTPCFAMWNSCPKFVYTYDGVMTDGVWIGNRIC
jgi:hypothetical protein